MTEIRIDNPRDMEESRIVINRNGWGYSQLQVEARGEFLVLEKETIRDEDFLGNCYRLPFYIAKDKLHGGKNFGSIYFSFGILFNRHFPKCSFVFCAVKRNGRL